MQLFGNLWATARNKRVARVALGYAAGAWLLAQIADLVLEAFDSPDWAMRLVLVVLIIGLPFAMAVAWLTGRKDPTNDQQLSGQCLDDISPGDTRYARSDGTSIAYQIIGSGPVDIVLVHGWLSNVELAWGHPTLRYFLQRLASRGRLIHFDKRGTGLSDRGVDLPTFEQRMDDVRAVMDAAASERAVLFGYSEGGPMCALFAATYPERTLGLILYGTYAKRVRSEDYPWAPTLEQRLADIQAVEDTWGEPIDVEHYAPSMVGDAEYAKWQTSYWRGSASPRDAAELLRMNTNIDVCHALPAIRVPTLLLHRTGDRDARLDEGRYLAERIPNASFIELPGSDHLPWIGEVEDIFRSLEDFIDTLDSPREFDSVLATLMAVVIQAAEGDAAEIRSFISSAVLRFRGQPGLCGTSSMHASFDGSGRAIRCALAIRDHCRSQDVLCRIGVHIGECERRGSQLLGPPVAVSHAVALAAAPAEVTVTHMVSELTTGFAFDNNDVVRLDGIEGEWNLFTVHS